MASDDPFRPVGIDETFYFACNPQVPCFNACCRDLNQHLTPYDVLRLARHLRLSSSDFLTRYTSWYEGPQTGLPVVTLTPADSKERLCPFLTDAGCRVYENRPASCRMYPLGRMLRRSREDGRLTESFVLISEAHCRGGDQPQPMTARKWVADQGLAPYNAINDAMITVIAAKQQYWPGPLGRENARKLYRVLYDMAAFQEMLGAEAGAGSKAMGLDVEDLDCEDELSVLRFAIAYAAGMLQYESGLQK